MKRLSLYLVISALFVSLVALDGMAWPLGGKEMVANGTGARTKMLIGSIYYLTLYIPATLKGKSGKEIIEANEPMALVLVIDSKMITRDKFLDAISDGFGTAAASGYTTPKKQAFQNLFKGVTFSKYDKVSMYFSNGAVSVQYTYKESKKTDNLGSVAGLDMKKALFAIWLGPKPIQEDLKKALLGGK